MSQYCIKFISRLLLSSVFFCSYLLAEETTNNMISNEDLAASVTEEYRVGSGDLLKVTVFNQEELSGEFTINGAGQIALPLVGDVNTKKLTVKQVEKAIADKLKPDYLLNPIVSVQMLNYRPYYILGEVQSQKSYHYVDGMTYINAVVIAGGYTYRAKEDHVMVIRMNDHQKKELRLNMDEKVLPGDVIRIEERFF
ncbi:polysaccharide biosynthesis/export family protein [Methylobacter psychrophilus]|uniref:polysaccharide biosynthesis/export family protein n=1 Tax=Methylobacter psychrophilus TaxID=96941 RepID=UPI0021D4D847|nr:polysaccharide biosynthesis/export family protein [Methylobacter psychrophilus]